MLITSSSRSGSDGSQASSPLGNWVLSPFPEAQIWISLCWTEASCDPAFPVLHLLNHLPLHFAPSLTFNIAVMILLGGIAAVLGREDESARELGELEVLKKMIEGCVCHCMWMNMCAFLVLLRTIFNHSSTATILKWTPPFLQHPLYFYNCCSPFGSSLAWVSLSPPSLSLRLAGLEPWERNFSRIFCCWCSDLHFPMFQVLPPNPPPFCILNFLQKTQQC